ncbi:hypothetical protein L210DRAFT_3567488 [Boletus edulis BED1]|uniref:Uncharacterized protein n=1 Tax=Boletus edulis BED1 TaxID=1328754 RepID=A0AAD4BFQ5_BOLED|nr:hypothetical protein L210DRAFT_3567488 [Boletus edulis BED1]
MTGEQVTTYSEDGEIHERDGTPRHKSPGSHDSFSCHNAIPPRGYGLGVCKSDVSRTSCDHGAALAAS